jgi:type IV pilus assembly protein PilP
MPAMPVPPTQAGGTAKESPKPAASAGAPVAPTAPTAPMTAAAKASALAEVMEGYTYDPKSRRDPFQSLTRLIKVDKTREEMPPLQRVQISDLKLLGIMWGGYGYYGLVRTPDGKGYTVKEGMHMGTNNGVITTITDKAIIVSEPSIDIMGNKSTKDVEILLRPKEVS